MLLLFHSLAVILSFKFFPPNVAILSSKGSNRNKHNTRSILSCFHKERMGNLRLALC
jgi:hypothetical protein